MPLTKVEKSVVDFEFKKKLSDSNNYSLSDLNQQNKRKHYSWYSGRWSNIGLLLFSYGAAGTVMCSIDNDSHGYLEERFGFSC